MVVVNNAQDDHGAGEQAGNKKVKAQRELKIEQNKEYRSGCLHKKIKERDFSTAVPAFSLKQNIRDHWNIVIKFDSVVTFWAGRRRLQDAHFSGYPENQNIEKTSPCQPYENNKNYLFHGMTAVVISPVSRS